MEVFVMNLFNWLDPFHTEFLDHQIPNHVKENSVIAITHKIASNKLLKMDSPPAASTKFP